MPSNDGFSDRNPFSIIEHPCVLHKQHLCRTQTPKYNLPFIAIKRQAQQNTAALFVCMNQQKIFIKGISRLIYKEEKDIRMFLSLCSGTVGKSFCFCREEEPASSTTATSSASSDGVKDLVLFYFGANLVKDV